MASQGRLLRSRPAQSPANHLMARSDRVTRGIAAAATTSVTVSRSSSTPAGKSRKSIRVTVKMPSSKLREVTNAGERGATSSGRRTQNTNSGVSSNSRNSRAKKRVIEADSSEEDDLVEEEEEEVVDSDAPGEEDDDELDADGDVDMDDASPQPAVQRKTNSQTTSSKRKQAKSVEEKEMTLAEEEDDEDDDDELSALDSDVEGEQDESMLQEDESGEGEGDEDEEDEEDEADELGASAEGSRASTPDYKKLTKRQRGSLGNDFLQLPMEPQVKKHLTAEERAMRRAEMARRRKNLSEKRNEEEKMDTINRLLKKQAPKRRTKAEAAETGAENTPDVPQEPERPNPTMIRWVSNRDGCRVAVPEELVGNPTVRVFTQLSAGKENGNGNNGQLVQEVQ